MPKPLYAALLVLSLLPAPADAIAGEVADYRAIAREAWKDCAPDRQAYCSGIVPGGGRTVDCLVDNRERLSKACAKHVAAIRAARSAWNSCAPDIKLYCPNIPQGGGRILACLSGNKDRISAPCIEGLKQADSALRY
jgi:Cysteine rich repeat